MAAGEAVARAPLAAGEPGAEPAGIEVATSYRDRGAWAALLRLMSEELHHAAYGIGAIEAAKRAAHDLGALEHARIQVLPGRTTRGGRAQPDAIDQQQRAFVVHAADEDAALLAEGAAGADIDAGLAAKELGDAGGVMAAQRRFVEQCDGGQRFVGGARRQGGGDHQGIEVDAGSVAAGRSLSVNDQWKKAQTKDCQAAEGVAYDDHACPLLAVPARTTMVLQSPGGEERERANGGAGPGSESPTATRH